MSVQALMDHQAAFTSGYTGEMLFFKEVLLGNQRDKQVCPPLRPSGNFVRMHKGVAWI